MNGKDTMGRSDALTPRGMLIGGLVGALMGAMIRGGITFYHFHVADVFGLLASLPSAGIGFLCGAVAGCLCRVWLGALIGALLSAGVFGLFVLPVAFLLAQFDAADGVAQFTWPLFLEKAIAGGIAGGVGGMVGRWVIVSDEKRQP